MKKRLQQLRNEEGLTLVELLAVIVILAIIAVVAFVMIAQVIENSKQDAHIANAQQMIASAKIYEAQGGTFAFAAVAATEDPTPSGEASISLDDLQKAGSIDKIYDSWSKKEITAGTIIKAGDEYKVSLQSVNKEGAATNDCNISERSEIELAEKDRKELCGITN